ncbi:MAG: hypothetical protein KatS3mg108_0167 [Isosphaeraceae bacterium]|nr:MAG: hypothetical protein KatS3mg108_0167 [Isosphaeraceae bacterium]
MKVVIGCFAVFISVFYAVGFGLLGYGLWSAWRSVHAAAWPTAPGTITHLALEEHSGNEDTTYGVKVKYTYTVDGVAYEGSCLAFGYARSNRREAHEQIHRKLKEAKAVGVRYDPSEPSVSCLSFGLHRSIQFTLVFAVTWLLIVFGFTLLFWVFSRNDAVLLDNLSVQ